MTRHDHAFTGRNRIGSVAPMNEPKNKRLDEIERALKFDPDPEYRRELIREYLDLTDPEPIHEIDF